MPPLLPLFVTGVTGIYRLVYFLTNKSAKTVFIGLFCLITVLLCSAPVFALSYLKVSIGSVSSGDSRLNELSLSVNDFDDAQSRMKLTAEGLFNREYTIENFQYDCAEFTISDQQVACAEGSLSLHNKLLAAENKPLLFTYLPVSGKLDVKASDLEMFSGKLSIDLDYQHGKMHAKASLEQVALSTESLAGFLKDSKDSGNEFETLVSGTISIDRDTDQVTSEFELSVSDVIFSNADGNFLADGLSSRINGKYRYQKQSHFLDKLSVSLDEGELLTPWFYTDLNARKAKLFLSNAKLDADMHWKVDKLKFNDQVLNITSTALKGVNTAAERFQLAVAPVDVSKVYSFYFQPILSNDLAQLAVNGQLEANLSMQEGKITEYLLKVKDAWLVHEPESGNSKFSIENLQGQLYTSNALNAASYLQFDNASFLDTIEFGSVKVPLNTTTHSVAVSKTTTLPVFDGSIMVEKFSLNVSGEAPEVNFEGILTPVSLSEVSQAFGWPEMSGKISGLVPAVSYSDGNARLAGTLLIRAFDGNILIRDVEASHLLSSWPVFSADVEMKNIDLEKLTQTFSFGKITGRVDGHVKNLLMENWQPTRFDAMLKTSENPGRKRISQRAVDNISNLGGAGMAGALSRSFMRFFEDFGYDKIGFSCLLRDGVCQMSGVEDTDQGYYLVKGGGIPRIDVIGHNKNTDWNVLLDRLTNIASSGSPTIQ